MMIISIDKRSMNTAKKVMLTVFFGMLSQWVLALDYPPAGDFAQGSKTWSENCARCHNMRSPTDLRDDQWVTAVFHMRVRAGLTGQDTRDILTFLQGSNARVEKIKSDTSKPLSVESQSGQSIYESNCVACHGINGKGAFPGVPDFTTKNGPLSKSDEELLSNIISGFQSPGNSMSMPPRGGNNKLSDDDLNAALKHIKSYQK